MEGDVLSVYVEHRSIVFPGELLAEGRVRVGYNVYREDDKLFSSILGLAEIRGNMVSVIPFKSYYIPKVGDTVIGIILDNSPTLWQVDINSPYTAIMQVMDALPRPIDPAKDDIRKYFRSGDVVLADVISFDKLRSPMISIKGRGLGKLKNGRLIEISPAKVPRLIGKKGSMITMIKKQLKCRIIIGRNGRVWISACALEVMNVVEKIVMLIDGEAQIPGLTERVKKLILAEKENLNLSA